MRINSRKIIGLLETLAPLHQAESWDSVGFQVGNPDKAIDKVMVALEVTDEVVREAEEKSVDLIITHHPLIFKPVKTVTEGDPLGRLLRRLIRSDIHVYAAHTNLDIASGGLNDLLAKALELESLEILRKTGQEPYLKLVVFVPETHAETVRASLIAQGAGSLGRYSECSFTSHGVGTFRPSEGANPAVGRVGELETVPECRLETLVPEARVTAVLAALKQAHPYEPPAYDLLPLANELEGYGIGRVGVLPMPERLDQLALRTKELLGSESIRYVGSPETAVRKVALCTGAGADLLADAKRAGCDVLITGDVKYHEARTAEQSGLAIIDAGHFETEQWAVSALFRWLKTRIDAKGYEVALIESEALQNPFHHR